MNMKKHTIILVFFAAFFVIAFGFVEWMHEEGLTTNQVMEEPPTQPFIDEPIQPVPTPPALNAEKVALGKSLFHEPRLSADNSISCTHCHSLTTAGSDSMPRSIGIHGEAGLVNAPTVFNAALNISQFWDGRASTLEKQIDGPVHSPTELGSDWPVIIAKLSTDTAYLDAFSRLYADDITSDNIKDAIATFERTLITLNSPFDRFLRGETNAISAEAKRGYLIFKGYGCTSCHQGANVGGNMYQRFGVAKDYFADHPVDNQADFGRFNVTGLEEDRHVFLVPSLRLATLTAPYFHNGSADTLEEAIRIMAKYQLDRDISEHEIEMIIVFLDSLVGDYNGNRLQP